MKKITHTLALSTILLGALSPTGQAIADTVPEQSSLPVSTIDNGTISSGETSTSEPSSSAPEPTSTTEASSTNVSTEEESNINEVTDTTTEPPQVSTLETQPASEDIAPADIASGSFGTDWVISDDGTLTIKSGSLASNAESGDSPWAEYADQITKINFVGPVTALGSTQALFYGLSQVNEIDNLGQFDITASTNMSDMFSGMTNLKALDLSGFNTANVTTMANMFGFDSSISSLDLSNFDTAKVTDMSQMFAGMSAITSLNVSSFNTSSVTSMYGMFECDSNLSTLDVSHFDTAKVTTMAQMFQFDSSLPTLDVSNFSTSNVTDLRSTFQGVLVPSLDVSNFDTSKVIAMADMFAGMESIAELDLSNINTSSVENMNEMFDDMPNLHILNLSGFDTSNVSDMENMFAEGTIPHQLILGKKVVLNDTIMLANPVSDDKYTGKWKTLGNGGTEAAPIGDWVGTSSDLVARSQTGISDTYVWETKLLVGDVTVKYVDENGNEIHDSQLIEGTTTDNVYDDYNTTTDEYKLTLDGYTLDENKLPTNATGKFTSDPQTVTYVYTKNEDKSAITVHDSTLSVGDSWDAKDNFDSALNMKGDKVPFDAITVDGTVDTSKAGVYKVTYSYKENTGEVELFDAQVGETQQGRNTVIATITVKDKAPVDPGNPTNPTNPSTPTDPSVPNGSGSIGSSQTGGEQGQANASNNQTASSSNESLPQTGEKAGLSLVATGFALLIALIGLILFRKPKKSSDE